MIDAESGCLNAHGWSAAQRRLIKSARADDRVLGCLMISLDDMTMLQAAHGEPMVQLLVATLARLTQESSPPAAAVARPDARSIAVMVPGFGVEDCQQLAKQIRRRVKHELASVIEGAASGSLSISVGIDALPARSNGAATLGERAEQAMARVRRAGGNDIAEFAPPRSEARTTPRSSPLRH
jgi:diguanylate cyclase (GGDEF)-like protein